MPADLASDVRQFARDFVTVTDAWVAEGWHVRDEVEAWRAVIREDMQGEVSVDAAIDPRPQRERIKAWCGTFRILARTTGDAK